MGRIRSEQYWAWLEEEGEGRMKDAVGQMEVASGDVEKCWEALRDGLLGILDVGKTEAKRMNRKKREKGDEIENREKELKELKEERKRIIVNSKEENVRR